MKTSCSLPTRIKRTATAAITHADKVEVLCSGGDNDDLKQMIRLRNEVDKEADALSQEPSFSAVLGHKPSKVETIMLSLLVASQFDRVAGRELKLAGDLISVTASRRAQMAVDARGLLREGGSLHELVWLDYGSSLASSRVSLKENVLSRLLGEEPGETDVRCDAVGMIAKGSGLAIVNWVA